MSDRIAVVRLAPVDDKYGPSAIYLRGDAVNVGPDEIVVHVTGMHLTRGFLHLKSGNFIGGNTYHGEAR